MLWDNTLAMWCKTIWLPKQRECAKSAINFTSTLPLLKNFSNTPENSNNGFLKSKVTCMQPYLKGLYQMSFPGNLTQCLSYSTESLRGLFSGRFFALKNGTKNSIFNWVSELNLYRQIFLHNTKIHQTSDLSYLKPFRTRLSSC